MGLGNVLLKRAMHDSQEPLSPTSAIVAFAPLTIGIHFVLAMSVDGGREVIHQVGLLADPRYLGIMVFAGWASMVGAMRAWSKLVRRYSVADVAPYSLLIPCFTLTFGFLMGETIGFNTFVSASLILSGLVISQTGRPVSRLVRGFMHKMRHSTIK
jgi:drug/metabolite transporter (DMT)-like permease